MCPLLRKETKMFAAKLASKLFAMNSIHSNVILLFYWAVRCNIACTAAECSMRIAS